MIHYIHTGAIPMMKEIGKIKLSEMRDHMRNNFRCLYFIDSPIGETEIAGCTGNYWCYPRKGGRTFVSKPDATVTVKKEVEE